MIHIKFFLIKNTKINISFFLLQNFYWKILEDVPYYIFIYVFCIPKFLKAIFEHKILYDLS